VSLKLLTQFANNGRLGCPDSSRGGVGRRGQRSIAGHYGWFRDHRPANRRRFRRGNTIAGVTERRYGGNLRGRRPSSHATGGGLCCAQIKHVRVFDCRRAEAEVFAADMSARLGIPVLVASSASEALAGAQVACTATTSSTPVFEDRDLVAGVHINAVGSWRPQTAEIPPTPYAAPMYLWIIAPRLWRRRETC